MEESIFPSPSPEDISEALCPTVLELVILPTEDCNFRCIYCYEEHKRGRMSPDIIEGIKRLIARRMEDIVQLRISWFGGEPLAAKQIVFEVNEYAYNLCKNNKVYFASDITTNGYFITPLVMERLVKSSLKEFFISLAGIGADHDKLRPLASGKGSFSKIWENLISLRNSEIDFNISLRLHYSPNISSCELLCRMVNEEFGGDRRFRTSLQRIADLGGENTGKFSTVSAEKSEEINWHLASFMPDMIVEDLNPKKSLICTAARPNNLVIRPDGQISKCLAHLDDPRNLVGRLETNGSMSFNRQRLQPWFKGFDNLDGKMLGCPIASVPRENWPTEEKRKIFPFNIIVDHAS